MPDLPHQFLFRAAIFPSSSSNPRKTGGTGRIKKYGHKKRERGEQREREGADDEKERERERERDRERKRERQRERIILNASIC